MIEKLKQKIVDKLNSSAVTRWGFRHPQRNPMFMIWREYRLGPKTIFTVVIFNSYDWIGI